MIAPGTGSGRESHDTSGTIMGIFTRHPLQKEKASPFLPARLKVGCRRDKVGPASPSYPGTAARGKRGLRSNEL